MFFTSMTVVTISSLPPPSEEGRSLPGICRAFTSGTIFTTLPERSAAKL